MCPHPIRVRTAALDEAAALAAVQNTSWRQTYSSLLGERFYDDEALAARVRMWERSLGDDRLTIRVAEGAGAPVGVALAGPALGEDAVREEQLFILYVVAAWHGTGAGPALLQAVLGDRPAQLWVAAENPRAVRFYAREGFRADGAELIDHDADDLREIRMIR
ncbi:GNAT family N-acetyltransferase [Nesterenkonia sp. HG001]|uniref:GNAT family N-acetyltransferase n=1 Tax=Nesterenkonia sp. HG001 TaxID=2983207 RepID=UPI002AC74C0B|nr:GNAT family N-acetyltransferase [Nesterenkonia sp. HG001]MDZ5077424.1 GNAT family N-acetyltransferase [Nesterenkonia sp. HG001]